MRAVGWPWSLLVAMRGQVAPFDESIPVVEEFGFGGEYIGRGYDPFIILGDHGIAGKAEVQYGTATEFTLLESFQVFAFYDFGVVWNVDRSPDEDKRDSATSAAQRGEIQR